MTDETKSGTIKDAADVIKGIVEAVPIYQDVAQPAAKEIGTALQTVAKTVHVALAPVSVLVWGYEQIREFVSTRVAEKLKGVPPEDIVTPAPNVAGPALESLKYCGHEETLREMYANLLAASMTRASAASAHPAFVEIIRQLTPDEARVLRKLKEKTAVPLIDIRRTANTEANDPTAGFLTFLDNFGLLGVEAGCSNPFNLPTYVGNICRLGLAAVPEDRQLAREGVYDSLETHPVVLQWKSQIEANGTFHMTTYRKMLELTALGRVFLKVCAAPSGGSSAKAETPKPVDRANPR